MKLILRSSTALLSVVVIVSTSFGTVKAQTVDLQRQFTALQLAICAQDWHQALQLIGPIIGSDEISSKSRADLVTYRTRLEEYRASQITFDSIPGCAAGAIIPSGGAAMVNSTNSVGSGRVTTSPTSSNSNASSRKVDWDEVMADFHTGKYDPGVNRPISNSGSSGGFYGSGGGSGSGNCDFPGQIAADGKRCGDRAASRRPGGR